MEVFLLFAMGLSVLAAIQIVGVDNSNQSQVIVIQHSGPKDSSGFISGLFYVLLGIAGLLCCLYNISPELFEGLLNY